MLNGDWSLVGLNCNRGGVWLRPINDVAYINLAVLDAVLKGFSLAIQWTVEKIHIQTDSFFVYIWVSDNLISKARLRPKAASEMMIPKWLDTL